MVALAPGKTVRSKAPTITVDAGLAVGTHVIALNVVDDAGNVSAAASLTVAVKAVRGPTGGPTIVPAVTPRSPAAAAPKKPATPKTKPRQR